MPLFKSDYSVYGIFSAFETIAWLISVRNDICLFIHLFKVHMLIVLASSLLVASVCESHQTFHWTETETNWNTVKLTMYGRASYSFLSW